jgi:hypothetical protein
VLLGGVALERGDLPLDVRPLERNVGAVREVEVVPRDLVAEHRGALEGAEALLRDRLVVLVDVVVRRLEDRVGPQLLPQPNEQLEQVLPVLWERPDVEVVHRELRVGDAEHSRRLAHLARERVRRETRRQRARRDRERDVVHLHARLHEARHRAAAAELAVVGVRGEHEHSLPRLDHAGTTPASSSWARRVSASAPNPSSAQLAGSSKKAL